MMFKVGNIEKKVGKFVKKILVYKQAASFIGENSGAMTHWYLSLTALGAHVRNHSS